MARIDRSEYPAIAQFVADGMNVPEIAAQFECTPANIYLIVTKIRNGEAGAAAAKLLAKAPAKRARHSTRKTVVQGSPSAPLAVGPVPSRKGLLPRVTALSHRLSRLPVLRRCHRRTRASATGVGSQRLTLPSSNLV